MSYDPNDELRRAFDDIIHKIVEQFVDELERRMEVSSEAKLPETEAEYRRYVWRFIDRNLGDYYKRGDPFVEELVQKAAARAKELTEEFQAGPSVTPKLVLLALYDFVILCDDSTSMRKGKRLTTLYDTCLKLGDIATSLQPEGIYLRFLNHAEKELDRLDSRHKISMEMKKVRLSPGTRLGTTLRKKIINPLIIERIKSPGPKRPVITIVITDGWPTGERDECFQEAITECKQSMSKRGINQAGAIFLISRVGSDPNAEFFLDNLRQNKKLNEMLYCCKDQLDDQREVFLRAATGGKKYTSFLIDLFVTALDSQTST